MTVSVSDAGKAWLDTYYPNGGYVEGFVYLTNADEENVDLSLPFMGFCGDWTEPPEFDDAFWYDNGMWLENYTGVDGNQYYTIMWTNLQDTSWVLSANPYVGAVIGKEGHVVYDSANNIVSPNGDGLNDMIDDMYVSLMRNAKVLTFTYTDEEGVCTVCGEKDPDYKHEGSADTGDAFREMWIVLMAVSLAGASLLVFSRKKFFLK